jgi:putative aldouronate transport system permease protein
MFLTAKLTLDEAVEAGGIAKPKSGIEWRKIGRNIIRDRNLFLMLIPFIGYYVLFVYKPMYGLQIAFKDYSLYKGIVVSPWVGFEHFHTFFNGPYFLRTMKNTLMISIYNLIFGFPAPIILALLLNEVRNTFFKKIVQTMTYTPYFISAVVVVGIVTNFLSPSHGIVNIILGKMGIEPIYFLAKPEYFRTIFTTMNIWKDVGFSAILYIAALSGISQELYESAVIDGANKWRQLWHITLPGILPTVMIMLILQIGSMLDVGYESIILLYQPATYEVSDVINTYVYRSGIISGDNDFATAVGLFNSTVGLILVIFANRLSKKYTGNGLW